jgi:Fur family transcriptional regulator, ferric uptake regulator
MGARTAGPALTKNHRLVYDILTEHGRGTHFSMAQLFELARRRRPGIGFTTVYRALMRLRDGALVSEIAIPGAESLVYEPAAPPHAHFRCSRCGRVEDVDYAVPPAVASKIAAANGCEVESVELSLHGRCRSCVGKLPKA